MLAYLADERLVQSRMQWYTCPGATLHTVQDCHQPCLRLSTTCSVEPLDHQNSENERSAIFQILCSRCVSPPTDRWQQHHPYRHTDNHLKSLPTNPYKHIDNHCPVIPRDTLTITCNHCPVITTDTLTIIAQSSLETHWQSPAITAQSSLQTHWQSLPSQCLISNTLRLT